MSTYSSLPPSNTSADPPGDITTWPSFSSTATRAIAEASMAAEPGDDKIGNFIFRKSSLTPHGNPMYDYIFVFTIKKANTENQQYNFIHRLFARNIKQKYMHVDANFQPATDVGKASNIWHDSIYSAVLKFVESLPVGPDSITAEEKEVLMECFMKA